MFKEGDTIKVTAPNGKIMTMHNIHIETDPVTDIPIIYSGEPVTISQPHGCHSEPRTLDEVNTRRDGFNTEFSQLAMEMIFAERRRQVQLGRDGRIPWACEAPDTDWGYRLGVLGEEFGEVCKAHIENQHERDLLEECIQVAAVAMACVEGMARKLGLDNGDLTDTIAKLTNIALGEDRVDEPEQPDSDSEKRLGCHTTDEHLSVLLEAYDIFNSRRVQRPGVWKREGARGALFNMKICMERVWWRYWEIDPAELLHLVRSGELDIDDFLDMINYAVFAVILLRAANRDGEWVYPPVSMPEVG